MKRGQKFTAMAECHAPGLYSIPLQVEETSCERMFIDTLGTAATIAPHNHRYGLTLTVLRGVLTHHLWQPDPLGAIEMWRHAWHSPLVEGGTGRFELKTPTPARFDISPDRMVAGEYVTLTPSQHHSLVTVPGTVWVVEEGLDQAEAETLWFAPTYEPDLTGLYVPFPAVAA